MLSWVLLTLNLSFLKSDLCSFMSWSHFCNFFLAHFEIVGYSFHLFWGYVFLVWFYYQNVILYFLLLFSYYNFMGLAYIIFCCLLFCGLEWLFLQGSLCYCFWALFKSVAFAFWNFKLCSLPRFYLNILFPLFSLYLLCSVLILHPVVYPHCILMRDVLRVRS